jgi:uncharacterized protein YuzE
MTTPTVHYDADTDAAYIRFSVAPVHESDEVAPGVVFDYDEAGHIVGMEVHNARAQLPEDVLNRAA